MHADKRKEVASHTNGVGRDTLQHSIELASCPVRIRDVCNIEGANQAAYGDQKHCEKQ